MKSVSNVETNKKQGALWLCFCLLFGLALGIISKFLDTISSNGSAIAAIAHFFADLFTRLGVWVFLAVVIAAYSRTWYLAAAGVFLFFAGMLVSYYLYSMWLFGFFPTKYFLIWSVPALASPALAVIAFWGRHHETCSLLLPSLPMGLMLYLSVSVGLYYVDIRHVEELFLLVAMGWIYYKKPKQMLAVTGGAILIFLLLTITRMI